MAAGGVEAFNEMARYMQEAKLSPESMADSFALARSLYESLQGDERVGALPKELQQSINDSYVGLQSRYAAAVRQQETDASNALASYVRLGAQADDTHRQMVEGLSRSYLSMRLAEDADATYDAISTLAEGAGLGDVVEKAIETAAGLAKLGDESGLTADGIEKLGEVSPAMKKAVGSFVDFLQVCGTELSDFAGMVNQQVSQAEKDADRQVTAKADTYADRKANVAAITAARDAGQSVWSASGFTGGMTQDDYQKLVDLNDDAYMAAVEYAHGGLFFNKDAFDRIVQQKFSDELKGLQQDVLRDTKKFNDKATEIFNKYTSGLTQGDNAAAFTTDLQSLITLGGQIDGYRQMASQIAWQTGDYMNWLNNKSGPESDDMFNEAVTAFQLIKDTQQTGRYGTRAYAAAMQLYTGQKDFSHKDLTSGDWSLMNLLTTAATSQDKNAGVKAADTMRKQLQKAGVLDETWGLTGDYTSDQIASMYNKQYKTNTNGDFWQLAFDAFNAYIEDEASHYQISGPNNAGLPQELLDAQKTLTDAVSAYKENRTDENLQAVADAAKAYEQAAGRADIDAMLEAGDVEGAAQKIQEQSTADGMKAAADSAAELAASFGSLTTAVAALQQQITGEEKPPEGGEGATGAGGTGSSVTKADDYPNVGPKGTSDEAGQQGMTAAESKARYDKLMAQRAKENQDWLKRQEDLKGDTTGSKTDEMIAAMRQAAEEQRLAKLREQEAENLKRANQARQDELNKEQEMQAVATAAAQNQLKAYAESKEVALAAEAGGEEGRNAINSAFAEMQKAIDSGDWDAFNSAWGKATGLVSGINQKAEEQEKLAAQEAENLERANQAKQNELNSEQELQDLKTIAAQNQLNAYQASADVNKALMNSDGTAIANALTEAQDAIDSGGWDAFNSAWGALTNQVREINQAAARGAKLSDLENERAGQELQDQSDLNAAIVEEHSRDAQQAQLDRLTQMTQQAEALGVEVPGAIQSAIQTLQEDVEHGIIQSQSNQALINRIIPFCHAECYIKLKLCVANRVFYKCFF